MQQSRLSVVKTLRQKFAGKIFAVVGDFNLFEDRQAVLVVPAELKNFHAVNQFALSFAS